MNRVFSLLGTAAWFGLLLCACSPHPHRAPASNAAVGKLARNRHLTPTSQVLTPAGHQVELPGLRPQALALSPDGSLLVTSGKNHQIWVIDPHTGFIRQQVDMPKINVPKPADTADEATETSEDDPGQTATGTELVSDTSAVLGLTGLIFSPDGRRLFVSNSLGDIKVFAVEPGGDLRAENIIVIPNAGAPGRKEEAPAGLAISKDGQRLYVAGNLGNKLYEFDAEAGTRLRSWDVGVAPFDVVLARGKAYVSNSGGRRPGADDLTAPAGKGTQVRVDVRRHLANEGSVSVVDLTTGAVKTEVIVELHASALAVSPDERHVVVANTGSDTLSVIATESDTVVERIWARLQPSDLFGAQPNALGFDRRGQRLFVCNGTQNAVAVVAFEPETRNSLVTGLIPVGWFPGAVVVMPRNDLLCVANIKGIGVARSFKPDEPVKLRCHSCPFLRSARWPPGPKWP
jgi:YVTN family beta-propeller protein